MSCLHRCLKAMALVDSAELFEALSHPVRIEILKILEKQPSSFSSLKKKLGIDSSGNLDHHLKKLSGLVSVRQDGLYGLTDAGKEARLSIDDVEMWTEMEKRKIKMRTQMPREAFFLGLLEFCATASLFWFFLAIMQAASWDSPWGYLFFGGLLLTGFCSGLGTFLRWECSWTMILAKAALIMSISLLLLDYVWSPNHVAQLSYVAICYLVFVAVEAVAVIVASRRPLKDFLGVGKRAKIPFLTIISSVLCISSGIMLILLVESQRAHLPYEPQVLQTVFASIGDPSILCGLLIMVGGVLILLGYNALGAATSIIFGFFPPLTTLGTYGAYHVFDIIYKVLVHEDSPYALVVAVVGGSLPIVGGLLALVKDRKIH